MPTHEPAMCQLAGNARQLVVTALNRSDAMAVARMKQQAEQRRSNPMGWPPNGQAAAYGGFAANGTGNGAAKVKKRSSKMLGF